MPEPGRLPLVLVIEDDLSLRRMYVEALAGSDFEVIEAHNGLQAIEKAMDLHPDVIVTDLALPGIDGFEVCRRLHRDPQLSTVPVVAITGRYLAAPDIERALRDGCTAVLLKPFDGDDLVAEVKKVLPRA